MKVQEITDAEKRELAVSVYPRLKKRRKLLRLLKIGNAAFLALALAACATTGEVKPEKPSAIGLQIKKEMTENDNPADFEKLMPDSDILLSSVVKFSKEPTIKTVADDVIDADYEKGLLVLLKSDRLETNMMDCPSILLGDDRYLSVEVENGLALVTGAKTAKLADIRNCGILQNMDSRGKGFSLSDKFLLEFSPNAFELYDSKKTAKVNGGNFLGSVRIGRLYGGMIMFANENGKIALMDGNTGKYTAIYPDSLDIKEAYFDGRNVFVYDSANKLMKLTADYAQGILAENGTAQAKDGCFFLKRSGRLYCDGYIFGLDTAYKSPAPADRGLVRDGLIFLIKDGVLSFVDPGLTYKKSILFLSPVNKLCLSEGRAYFKDFDGSARYVTASGTEKRAEDFPESCDYSMDMKDGAVVMPDGKEFYRFADVVNSSDKAVMLKRKIGDDIYYYFEMR